MKDLITNIGSGAGAAPAAAPAAAAPAGKKEEAKKEEPKKKEEKKPESDEEGDMGFGNFYNILIIHLSLRFEILILFYLFFKVSSIKLSPV